MKLLKPFLLPNNCNLYSKMPSFCFLSEFLVIVEPREQSTRIMWYSPSPISHPTSASYSCKARCLEGSCAKLYQFIMKTEVSPAPEESAQLKVLEINILLKYRCYISLFQFVLLMINASMTKVSKCSSQICVKFWLYFNCPSIPSSSAIFETKPSWRDLRSVGNSFSKETQYICIICI